MNMSVITFKKLKDAIIYAFSCTPDEASKHASIILDLFGFDEYIIDNILSNDERRLILNMQTKGMISAMREDTTLSNGAPWRIYYWHLEVKTIIEYAKNKKNKRDKCKDLEASEQSLDIYSTITDNQWMHHQ